MAHLTIRIDFESKAAFGPGKARLLEAIEATGSIRKAASSLGMSYRRAWMLLQAIEETFRGNVTIAETGGRAGGGTKLTDLGQTLVAQYRAIERNAERASEMELDVLRELANRRSSMRGKVSKTRKSKNPVVRPKQPISKGAGKRGSANRPSK